MESVKNLTDSTLNTLKNRLVDPILGSYILSFFIYNWEIALMLFSGKDIDEKISAIKGLLYPGKPLYLNPFLVPFIVSIIYLFVMPRVFRPANKWLLKRKVLSENDRYEAEVDLAPTQRIILELKDQVKNEISRINDLNSLKRSHEETIHLLKEQIQTYEIELKKIRVDDEVVINYTSEAISALEKRSLKSAFANIAPQIITSNMLVGSTRANEIADTLAALFSVGLIERIRVNSTSSAEQWKLTALGNDVLKMIQNSTSL